MKRKQHPSSGSESPSKLMKPTRRDQKNGTKVKGEIDPPQTPIDYLKNNNFNSQESTSDSSGSENDSEESDCSVSSQESSNSSEEYLEQKEVFHPYAVIVNTKSVLKQLFDWTTALSKEIESIEQGIRDRSKLMYKMTLNKVELTGLKSKYLVNLYQCLQKREYLAVLELRSRVKRKEKSSGNEEMPSSPMDSNEAISPSCNNGNLLDTALISLEKLVNHYKSLEISTDPIQRFDAIEKHHFTELSNNELNEIYRHIQNINSMVWDALDHLN